MTGGRGRDERDAEEGRQERRGVEGKEGGSRRGSGKPTNHKVRADER